MRTLTCHRILTLSALVTLLLCIDPALAITKPFIKNNTVNEISAPHTNYRVMYTLNADDAFLQKKSGKHYVLALKGLHDKVIYKIEKSTLLAQSNGLISLGKFINLWLDKAGNYSVNADVTGVQVDHTTIGHTQFYAIVLLSSPNYDKHTKELIFDLLDEGSLISVDGYTMFHNVTIFY